MTTDEPKEAESHDWLLGVINAPTVWYQFDPDAPKPEYKETMYTVDPNTSITDLIRRARCVR